MEAMLQMRKIDIEALGERIADTDASAAASP
jgi:hypothetical protein